MIDVKTLRIGSHINADGIRAKVVEISKIQLSNSDYPYRVFVEGINSHGDKQIVGGFVNDDKFDPIPLTAELLTEIGFEQEQSYYILTLPDEVTIYADAVEDEMNNWNIQVFATKLYKRGEVFVRYLHELESFVYLTIGKELIKK